LRCVVCLNITARKRRNCTIRGALYQSSGRENGAWCTLQDNHMVT